MIRKNILRNSKKAFAFTFLAFFLSVVVFSFVAINMNKSDFTKDNEFKDARISYIDDEIKYFKNSYVNSILSYSLFSSFDIFTNYSRIDTNYLKYSNNYSKFQEFVVEGMINGSFDSEAQGSLENKTINYFMDEFSANFYDAYKGNFSFRVLDLYLFEDKPYYVSAQMLVEYNITTIDNISNWNFEDKFVVSIPIDSLYDPEFVLLDDLNVTIRPSERYLSESNWTHDMLKEVLTENYSLVFYEPTYKYTLGGSYLSRFMNVSVNSYEDVLGFWSFDYDEENFGVVDSSIYSPLANHYGNSRMLMSFDSVSLIGNEVLDLSAYKNNGTIFNGVNCSVVGIRGNGCLFDGIDDYIEILDNESLNFTNSSFSISVWVDFNESFSIGDHENIISKSEAFILRRSEDIDSNSTDFFIWDGVDYEPRLSIENLDSGLNHIVAVYNLEIMSLYVNGIKKNTSVRGNYNVSSSFPLYIGSLGAGGNFLNGTIDEVGIYSKELTDNEIADLYREKKALYVDYKDSLHGRGIEFDGVDDYVEIINSSDKFQFGIDDFSLCAWFKPNFEGQLNLYQQIIVKRNSSIINGNFEFELENSSKKLKYLITDSFNYSTTILESYEWYYSCVVREAKISKLFVNGYLESTNISFGSVSSSSNLFFGMDPHMNLGAGGQFFKGIIDEVKIYNRTLTDEEIQRNYFNYAEFGKGCCNYITLINPNTMNYNNAAYDGNHSYSSKFFYDIFKRSKSLPEVALYNITNITSSVTTDNYYNLVLDKCLADAYSIFGYQEDDENITTNLININTLQVGTNDCSSLIRLGYY
ncbi:MAG: LamG domain-containing protein [Candidatus Woesearchaeota archaeon]|jgi:hypothetical protein|nr:LamG domain-containing protein [Candidatus Woesearchaeota archaeon]